MLIVFDLDGTIFKTETASIPATIKALNDLNLSEPSPDYIKSLIGRPMDDFCNNLLNEKDKSQLPVLIEKVREYEREIIRTNVELYPGIIDVFENLVNNDCELAICSNGSLEYINLVLKASQIFKYFIRIKAREQNKSKAERLAELMSEIYPDECVFIGDTAEDINAANQNNIPSIAVRYGYGNENIDSATFSVKEAIEIPAIIEKFKICSLIHKKIQAKKFPIVIGINGVDTSGKTQLSYFLNYYLNSKGLKTALIHLDDFHNPLHKRRQGRNEQEAYIKNAFNLNLIKESILVPLKQDKNLNVELELLDLDTDTFINTKHFIIDEDTIVILEGTLLFREPIVDYLDFKIYIDVSFDEVIQRAIIRDVPKYGMSFIDKYRQKYIPIQRWYLENYNPKLIADIIIDNENFNEPRIISN